MGNGRSCLTGAYCRWGISERQPATARYFYPLLWGLLYRTRQHTGQLDWQQLRRIESSANLTRVGTDSRPQHQRRQGYVDDLDKVPIPSCSSVARRSTRQLRRRRLGLWCIRAEMATSGRAAAKRGMPRTKKYAITEAATAPIKRAWNGRRYGFGPRIICFALGFRDSYALPGWQLCRATSPPSGSP